MRVVLASIALELATVFVAGGDEVRCSFHSIGGEHHCRVWRVHGDGSLYLPDGVRASRADTPVRLPELLHELRSESYREGKGTWFRFSAHLDNAGELLTSEDFEQEPYTADGGRFTHAAYLREQTVFPRDAMCSPAWFSAQLLKPSAAMA